MMKIFYPFFWKNIWSNIKCCFRPRQRWLTKKIPNHWCDKVDLIQICLFESIVHFVEKEMHIISWDWDDEVKAGHTTQEISDSVKQNKRDILEIYKYIKEDRPALEKKIHNSYPEFTDDRFEIDPIPEMIGNIKIWKQIDKRSVEQREKEKQQIKEVFRLQRVLNETDQRMLHKIIDLREVLWT